MAASNNEEWGTVEGQGMYYHGEQATLTAVPATSCAFDGWTDGNEESPRIVTVTQDTLFTAIFSFAEGIAEAGTLDFAVMPNPTTGLLTVRMEQTGAYEVTVYDVNGKALLDTKATDSVIEIDMSTLPAGQYRLLIRDNEHFGVRTVVKK